MENSPAFGTSMSPDEELAFIHKIISDSRRAFSEDGKPYIVWGLIVAIGMGINYLSALNDTDYGLGYLWIGLVLLGWGYMVYLARKNKGKTRTKSILNRIQGAIWGACGTALGLGVFLCMVHIDRGPGGIPSINGLYACFIASLILGIAYFLSGVANELNWLRNIGIVWWIGAVIMYVWVSIHVLALYATMLIVFQVIPGIILNRRYRAEAVSVAADTEFDHLDAHRATVA